MSTSATCKSYRLYFISLWFVFGLLQSQIGFADTSVDDTETAIDDAESVIETDQEISADTIKSFPSLFNPFFSNYVIAGADSDTTNIASDEEEKNWDIKFQISFLSQINTGVTRLENRLGDLSRIIGKYVGPWYFGYTQESYWDTGRSSSPFRESNYRPEFFFHSPVSSRMGQNASLYYGWVHESNGRDGDESGGWDRLFVRYNHSFGKQYTDQNHASLGSTWNVDLRVWHILNESRRNDDIWDYAGSAELKLNVRHNNICPFSSRVCAIGLTLRKGGKFSDTSHGLLQFEHRFPITRTGINFVTQVTTGHGHSIERYNQHESAIRIGFQFSDLTVPQ